MAVLDLKKEYLSEDEVKDYNASLAQISILENEIETRKIIIDQLRNGIMQTNRMMNKRHIDYMMSKIK